MAKKSVQISAGDIGVVIQCTLVFTDFDPSGGTAALYVGNDRGRGMTLVGDVASYTVKANDFESGYLDAQVRVTKGGVTVSSETFTLIVLP